MNRRGFLGMLGAALAGSAVDPGKLLWVPGAKTISIPKPTLIAGPSLIDLDLEEFHARYIKAAARSLAAEVDRQITEAIGYRWQVCAGFWDVLERQRIADCAFLQGSTWNPTQTCPQS